MMNAAKTIFNAILLTVVIALIPWMQSCKNPVGRDFQKQSLSKKGMVVSANRYATEVGLQIMQLGGNAVDAAIAVHFALAVVYPRAGNLGGGGFLVYRDSVGNIQSLDFREKAPEKANKDMYLDSLGTPIPEGSQVGGLAVGVPGSVAGMWEMYTLLKPVLPWEKLVQPAIQLAREGFAITREEADRLNEFQIEFKKHNPPSCPFIKEKKWEEGDILLQEDLAITLEQIAISGKKAFYEGSIADNISITIQEKGGIMTKKDLMAYNPIWRKPIHGKYGHYDIYTMGPPSGGGLAILQIAGMLATFSPEKTDALSPYNIHLYAEASRNAFEDRAQWLGDPDFVKVPVHLLLSPNYLRGKMESYSPEKARKSKTDTLRFNRKESYETTHFTVADHAGRCVSITTTLNSNYGSLLWVPSVGCFLNNEMDDFSCAPGHPNQYGLVGSKANEIEGNKRMLSSMSPTIVTRDGNLFLALGAPGGPTIVASVWQTILNVIDFDMELKDAVATGRYHHQWIPDEIVMEQSIATQERIKSLADKGHKVRTIKRMGSINAIKRHENGMLEGVADPRDQSHAQGL